ncbi:flagellar biosynthetic protein FliO [Neorhizobium galegae]|uniref:flagellar biosynthetic protein FliO n=1 Tax=Neorhizobium galegae TaxID=399 RepID=UPI002104F9AB|nr:flagellar biosynthetic protein FliO [Neorhizobium galegae]MCQ1836861.1 flagellar biosynthetic protein FliO [Neorhizobium galegae]UIY30927.1 flagellar biosynthetic protein FliO [Neorhizobium galegae]
MFEELMGAYGGRLVIAVAGVGIGLLVLIGVLWLIRSRSGPSPFVRGGKNRQPRLQVLDAAAVDARRRLVLIRRDGVEHLIMIGGPTDIVIESGISTAAPAMPATAANRFQPMDMTVPVQVAAAMEARPAAVAEPRPAPIPRPAAPEQRVEPARESAVPPRETPRAAPPVAPMTGPIPMSGTLAPRPASPAPANNAAVPEPATAPRIEPPARQAPEVKSDQLRPIAALAAAAAPPPASVPAQVPAFDDAADVLDAARGRVFQEAPEPRAVPVSAAIVPPALQSAAGKPKQLGSDFERILEEEMANNLAAREAPVIPQPNRQMQPRSPGVPPVTGATPEPSLQSEVARIFGEMSVTRDK